MSAFQLNNIGAKESVIEWIADGRDFSPAGRSNYQVGTYRVHVRFCSPYKNSCRLKSNINSNSLSADFELWICGDPEDYFLIPIATLRQVYEHPNGYPDRHNSGLRIVSVDACELWLTYARGVNSMSLLPFYRKKVT